jgi:hypothetical protein
MREFLHHATSVLLAIPTWLGPLMFLPVARSRMEKYGPRGLWRAWLAGVLAFAAFSAVGWFIAPDNSGWPLATVTGEIILIAPALAAVAVVLQETQASTLPMGRRMTIAGVVGMGALLLCFMPAALVSSLLGGGEIGGGC